MASKTNNKISRVSKKPRAKSASRASSSFASWEALRPGDLVDVVAPGFCPTDDEVEAGVKFLESWGLRARLPHDLFGADVIASNTDEKRLKHLSHALLASDSRAVWCLRGGYGAIRLVPGLLKLKKPARAKVVLGLSDVTTIQQWLAVKWKWPSLQAPLLDRLGRTVDASLVREGKPRPPEAQVEELRRIVFGETSTVLFEGLHRLAAPSGEPKKSAALIRGRMTGGNLVTYASAIGTKIHPSTEGQILYFEDIGERGYRVDRLLEQLVQTEVVTAKTRAIVFGEFVAGLETDGASRVPAVLERFAREWGARSRVPMFTGVTSGHGLNQRVVPLGTEAVLDLRSGSLEIETAVVHSIARTRARS
ncbi:LD-carboxypeptidase [soil metagenome]